MIIMNISKAPEEDSFKKSCWNRVVQPAATILRFWESGKSGAGSRLLTEGITLNWDELFPVMTEKNAD